MVKPVKGTEVQGPADLVSRIVCRVAAIIVLSFALGLAFNASNPIGVAWSSSSKKTEPTPARQTLASLSANTNAPQAQSTVNVAANPTVTIPVQVPQTSAPPAAATPVSPLPATQNVASATNALASSPNNATNIAPPSPPPPRTAQATTWAATKPLLAAGKVVLVDARPKPIYEAGHIPGAISLPEASTPEEFAAFQKQHGTNAHVIVYCSSTSCSISARVGHKLIQQYGFATVEFMTGGYQEWQQAQLSQSKTNANDKPVKP